MKYKSINQQQNRGDHHDLPDAADFAGRDLDQRICDVARDDTIGERITQCPKKTCRQLRHAV